MKTIKFYRSSYQATVYMGYLKAQSKAIGNVLSWLNSSNLHFIKYEGIEYGSSYTNEDQSVKTLINLLNA